MTAKTHGHKSGGKASPTYQSWRDMLNRCYRKKTTQFADYGGRGIRVCKRWRKFENFLADMGERPKELQLDRKDNDANYCKKNCRWATRSEQAFNRRNARLITINGATMNLLKWANRTGIHRETIAMRLKRGLSPKDAVSKPLYYDRRS